MNTLQNKIDTALDFLRRAERLALKMQPEHGFWLCYSGGKDSDVILELAKMAGVKFTAYYNVTTIDPPELVRYIIEKHPEVKRLHPEQTFLQIIKKKKILPTRLNRFCCQVLKERTAAGYCAITGVRAAESVRRKKQAALVKLQSKKKVQKKDFEQMQETNFQCIGGNDKVIINPILSWSESDVWQFIKERKLDYCKLYDEGFSRLGCLFCPMSRKRERERERSIKDFTKILFRLYLPFLIKTQTLKRLKIWLIGGFLINP